MEPLTRRQQDVLHYIADGITSKRRSPTYQELASAFGVCVANIQKYVSVLKRKGYLTSVPKIHRGLRLAAGRREWKVRREWRGDFEERVGRHLRDETDLRRVFAIVGGEARAWLGVERAELLVWEPQRRGLCGSAYFDVNPAGPAGAESAGPPPDSPAARALRRRRPLVEGPLAALPIPGRERVLGVVVLEDRRPGALGEVTLARAGMLAAALAPALERGTLHAELERRIRLQAALVALVRSVNATEDLQRVVRDVRGIVETLVDAPCLMIAVKDDEERWWLLLQTDRVDGRVHEMSDPTPMNPIENEAWRELQRRPWYILHRTPEQIRALEAGGEHPSAEGWNPVGITQKRSRSFLCVPLKTEGGMVGYLSAQSYEYNRYSIRDAEDLILIGEYVGLALRNAWRRAQEREGKRSRPEAPLLSELSKLEQKLRERASASPESSRADLDFAASELASLRVWAAGTAGSRP